MKTVGSFPNNQTGELVAAGSNIMRGYWKDEQATAGVLDPNGYHTGDLGYRDDEGYFYLTGRNKTMCSRSAVTGLIPGKSKIP
jgi:long-subunit acyl-CoA synthetase (AMP-forming)